MIDTYEDIKINSTSDFVRILKKYKSKSSITIPYDIETYTTNRSQETKKPSLLQTYVFSVCFSIYDFKKEKIYLYIFPTFKKAIDYFLLNSPKKFTFIFTAHNGNKYDNHFFRYSLVNDYHLPEYNEKKKNLIKDLPNHKTKKEIKSNYILSSRVKSSTNLTFTAKIDNLYFKTSDTFPKTNLPLSILGKKLVSLNLLSDNFLKTSLNYLKYDKNEEMSYFESIGYSQYIFNNLTRDELIYIFNDVIILQYVIIYFDNLFPNFDYSKTTFMQNVKMAYEKNPLTFFQLEKKSFDNDTYYEYDDFIFNNMSYYDYLQKFYRGGLNFYNDRYLGKIINNLFSIDINSSYPFVLYTEKYPYKINNYSETPFILNILNDDVKNNNIIYYIELSKDIVNKYILKKIKSINLKKMIVKYYHQDLETNNIYISSIFLNCLKYDFNIDIDLTSIPVLSFVSYTTKPFGARDIISDFYYVKTQGKQKYKLNYQSPLDISLTSEINENQFTKEEIDNSKRYLNGIYGLPALRKFFDYFYIDDNIIQSLNFGFENKERNILLSATVTMYTFRNLIKPLKYFKKYIDDYFCYCDTDSLYLKKEAFEYIPKTIYHSMNLGSWDIEHENISKFFVINHKKYCLFDDNKITVRCAGIPLSNFNTNMSFETFIKTQFTEGIKVKSTRSILNTSQTISIYQSLTEFKKGFNYHLYYQNINTDKLEKFILSQDLDEQSELLYIESENGAFSKRDFAYLNHQEKTRYPISLLVKKEKYINIE